MSKVIKWWLLTAVTGFASFISFFQVNSYAADKHNINGLWVILGIVFGLAALYCFYQVTQNANTGGSQEK